VQVSISGSAVAAANAAVWQKHCYFLFIIAIRCTCKAIALYCSGMLCPELRLPFQRCKESA
jgi:hypothetical protein